MGKAVTVVVDYTVAEEVPAMEATVTTTMAGMVAIDNW